MVTSEADRMFRAGLRHGADVLEQAKRDSDLGTFTAGVEACVEVLRKLADGETPKGLGDPGMTKKVLKWSVPLDDYWHDIGTGLPCLVGEQGDVRTAQVWTIVGEKDGDNPWIARVFGTGPSFAIPDDAIHLGSYQSSNGLVWHVFAMKEIP